MKKCVSFEIKKGLLGIGREVFLLLTGFMFFEEKKIKNLVGMCKESAKFIEHPFFEIIRKAPVNYQEYLMPVINGEKFAWLDGKKLKFNLEGYEKFRSLFFNILIKDMIFECQLQINYSNETLLYAIVGVVPRLQIHESMVSLIGQKSCGGGLAVSFSSSYIVFNGKCPKIDNSGGIESGGELKCVVDNYNNEKKKKGRMYFAKNMKWMKHVIVNVPSDGVYFGASGYQSTFSLTILSLKKLLTLPVYSLDGCQEYDFGFG